MANRSATPRRGSWWTWNLGRIAGIPIRVHLTLVVLLGWIALTYALSGAGARVTGIGMFLVVSIFVIIVVHELGHALVARHYGIATRDILLLPVGGIASVERMPDRPRQELAVAIVGPAINLVIAAVLWLGISLAHGTTAIGEVTSTTGAIATQLLWINVGLAVFNLIPAFPMDGGRALRALLAMRLGQRRATDIAAALGRWFAVGLAFLGIFYNPLLILIAAVVWFGATQERALVHLKSVIAGVPVSAAMLRRVDAVTPDQPLEDAAALLLGQHELPVIDRSGHAVGVLTRGDVATALAHAGPDATVASAPHHEVVTVAPSDLLDTVLDRLRESPDSVALVVEHDHPVGILTAEYLAAYVALHERDAA